MWYVYVLRGNKPNWHYYGVTSDLRRRYDEHASARVKSTARYLPIELIYYEAYSDETIARKRERTLKTSRSATSALLLRLNENI